MVKTQKSETMKKAFPMKRILAIAGLTSAAYYRKKPAGKENVRRGPKPKISDEDLLVEIRAEILHKIHRPGNVRANRQYQRILYSCRQALFG